MGHFSPTIFTPMNLLQHYRTYQARRRRSHARARFFTLCDRISDVHRAVTLAFQESRRPVPDRFLVDIGLRDGVWFVNQARDLTANEFEQLDSATLPPVLLENFPWFVSQVDAMVADILRRRMERWM